MPTTAVRAKRNEIDIIEFQSIIDGEYSPRLKSRARCILLSACTNKENKDIAKELGFTPNQVGNWVRRYNAEGIKGLFDKPKSGRKGGEINPGLEAQIREKLDQTPPAGLDQWSVEALAEALNSTPDTIRNITRSKRIPIQRVRSWNIDTIDELTSHSLDVVGLLITPTDRVIAVRRSNGAPALHLKGSFCTKNRDLWEEISRARQQSESSTVSLNQILVMASEHASDERRFAQIGVNRFLNELADEHRDLAEASYTAIVYSNNAARDELLRHQRFVVTMVNSPEEWLAKAESVIDLGCETSTDVRNLKSALNRYLGSICSRTESFQWHKTGIAIPPQEETVTRAEAESAQVQSLQAASSDSDASIKKGPRMTVSFSYTDERGATTTVTGNIAEGLMDSSECDLSSRDSINAFVMNLTENMVPLVDAVTSQAGAAVLESVKKKH